MIQVFMVTENHTCADILGMLFAILCITFPSYTPIKALSQMVKTSTEWEEYHYSTLLSSNVILLALNRDNSSDIHMFLSV